MARHTHLFLTLIVAAFVGCSALKEIADTKALTDEEDQLFWGRQLGGVIDESMSIATDPPIDPPTDPPINPPTDSPPTGSAPTDAPPTGSPPTAPQPTPRPQPTSPPTGGPDSANSCFGGTGCDICPDGPIVDDSKIVTIQFPGREQESATCAEFFAVGCIFLQEDEDRCADYQFAVNECCRPIPVPTPRPPTQAPVMLPSGGDGNSCSDPNSCDVCGDGRIVDDSKVVTVTLLDGEVETASCAEWLLFGCAVVDADMCIDYQFALQECCTDNESFPPPVTPMTPAPAPDTPAPVTPAPVPEPTSAPVDTGGGSSCPDPAGCDICPNGDIANDSTVVTITSPFDGNPSTGKSIEYALSRSISTSCALSNHSFANSKTQIIVESGLERAASLRTIKAFAPMFKDSLPSAARAVATYVQTEEALQTQSISHLVEKVERSIAYPWGGYDYITFNVMRRMEWQHQSFE